MEVRNGGSWRDKGEMEGKGNSQGGTERGRRAKISSIPPHSPHSPARPTNTLATHLVIQSHIEKKGRGICKRVEWGAGGIN